MGAAGTQFSDLELTSPDAVSSVFLAGVPIVGSPLLDAGSPNVSDIDFAVCPTTDITGDPRPRDNDGDQLPRCTIGAFEDAAPEIVFKNGFEIDP